MKNIFSIDVEDWFHILELDTLPEIGRWSQLESRVEANFTRILDEFDEAGAKMTCFFLGWVAEQFPGLVREAHSRGHEIASHGYAHQLIYSQTREAFAEDIRRSKSIIEDIASTEVLGYRAPGFSISYQTPWAFDEIAAAGFQYDSSVFPATRGHQPKVGDEKPMKYCEMAPHWIETESGRLLEMPISVLSVASNARIYVFGGGYFRLAPYRLINTLSRLVNKSGRPVIYYLHPREIDPDHPRIPMSRFRRFKSYINLRSTLPKLRKVLSEHEIVSFRDWFAQYPPASIP